MEKIVELLDEYNCSAVIFDLDGTILDNNAFHLKAWKRYLEEMGRTMGEEEYNANLNGRTNKDVIEYIYQRKMDDAEALPYALKKESIYREIYKPEIKPVDGLIDLLEILHKRHVPLAIATSGIQVNIDFMFDNVPIKKYFPVVVNSSHIRKGKPDPEIFLQAAKRLNTDPQHCLVFEDAVVGIKAARGAGMKVIAISTTQTHHDLKTADLIIKDFTELL